MPGKTDKKPALTLADPVTQARWFARVRQAHKSETKEVYYFRV